MAYQAYSLAGLKGLLASRYDGNPFWVGEEARLAFNEGLRTWNLLTGFWKQAALITTTAGTFDYTLPATLLYRTRLTWNGRPMGVTSLTGLDYARRQWMTETTASGGDVPSRPILWAPVSLQWVRIWPADAVGGATIQVNGVANTPVLVDDADTLDLGDDLLDVLLGYALHVVSFKRGLPALQATMPGLVAFLQAAAQQNRMILASAFYRKFLGLDRQRQMRMLQVPAGGPSATPTLDSAVQSPA